MTEFVCPLSQVLEETHFLKVARRCSSTGEFCWNWNKAEAVRVCEYAQKEKETDK